MKAAIKNMDSAYLTPLTKNPRGHAYQITDLPQVNDEIRAQTEFYQTHHWVPSIKLIVHI